MSSLAAAKDEASRERNICVAALCRVAQAMGFPVGLALHDPSNADWEDDWHNVVLIDLPTGQVSWHIHDSELPLFSFVHEYQGKWDGHTTEEKYYRLQAEKFLWPMVKPNELVTAINGLADAVRLQATPEWARFLHGMSEADLKTLLAKYQESL